MSTLLRPFLTALAIAALAQGAQAATVLENNYVRVTATRRPVPRPARPGAPSA